MQITTLKNRAKMKKQIPTLCIRKCSDTSCSIFDLKLYKNGKYAQEIKE